VSGRDDYPVVGAAMRSSIELACRAQLTVRQHRTFLAALAFTASWSRLEDDVYLAQLAAVVYGSDDVQRWQCRKVADDLRALRAAGVLHSRAPIGRPRDEGPRPRYRVGLRSAPDPGSTSGQEVPPISGADCGESAPDHGAKRAPTPGAKVPPPVGAPTEKFSEKSSEGEGVESRGVVERLVVLAEAPKASDRKNIAGCVGLVDEADALAVVEQLERTVPPGSVPWFRLRTRWDQLLLDLSTQRPPIGTLEYDQSDLDRLRRERDRTSDPETRAALSERLGAGGG
jgi:hypothetical protein